METCNNCGNPLILIDGKCSFCHQSPGGSDKHKEEPPHHHGGKGSDPESQVQKDKPKEKTGHYGEEPLPSKHGNRQDPKHKLKRSSLVSNNTLKKLVIGICIMAALILLYILLGSLFSKTTSRPNDIIVDTEKIANIETYPQDISGNYFARKMNFRDDVNATIKIYIEGSEYAMNVYSSVITKKYIFSYDPLSGEIISGDLGNGKVRIKELTNEIEITFEGWELIK